MKKLSHVGTALLLVLLAITLAFRTQTAKAVGTIRILANGTVDPSTAPISTVDGITYALTADITDQIVVEKNNSIIDGADHIISGDGSGNGFELYSVSNVLVKNTVVQNFLYGFYVDSSSSIRITENTITMNSYDGTGLFSVTSSLITENNITLNGYDGIEIYTSLSVNITNNFISSNGWYGIGAYDCPKIKIEGNRIADNYNGIEIFDSPGTSIFHNDFINHTSQVSILSTVATWENGYPSGGNYWSDYTGVDLQNGPNQNQPGSDGIGDTPYLIDSNNTDRYPLMNPWTPPSGHDVAVISIVSYKTVVGQGMNDNITVYSADKGEYTETLNITVYSGAIPLASKAIQIESGLTANVPFSWNTTGFDKGNYTISAYAWPVLGETDTSNNNFTGGRVIVALAGDLTGGTAGLLDFVPDGKVDMKDVGVVARFFGQNVPPAPPNCDVRGLVAGVPDGKIDMLDIGAVARHFGEHAS